MLPILLRLTFESLWSQLLLYAVALGVVGYIAWNGWRGAQGAQTEQGARAPVKQAEQLQRAALYGVGGAVLAFFGLKYALPSSAFPGGKGEGIPVHTYGVLLATGFFCAVTVAARLAQQEWRKVVWVDGQGFVDTEGPRRREQVLDLGFWVLVGGLVGSRILFIIVNWKDYARDLSSIFSLGGGLVFYGGLIGAAVAAYGFARVHGMEFLRLADLAIPTVSLGQALGRLGCFSAGCCWGGPAGSHAHLAVRFPGSGVAKDLFGHLTGTGSTAFSSQANDPRYVIEATGEILQQAAPGAVRISEWAAQHGTTLPVHPTQLFESVGQVLIFASLLFLR
ncbi:MAG: prolipoprotein diacylglyceryl transferase, partial [Hyalangium sp.]|uniref:prolipoprotein diacylglyceryl transferase n=1 Tax=Hyalangium sp. TaxID=2028555 RepID=UPI00389A1DCE